MYSLLAPLYFVHVGPTVRLLCCWTCVSFAIVAIRDVFMYIESYIVHIFKRPNLAEMFEIGVNLLLLFKIAF